LNAFARRAADLKEKEALGLTAFLAPVPLALSEPMPPKSYTDVSGRSVRGFLGGDGVTGASQGGRGVFVTGRQGNSAGYG
jgi:hypothetical protein